jgi:hypothetical protein
MKIILLQMLLLISATGDAQNIRSIKTDADCLSFIRGKLGEKKFEFDTSFNVRFAEGLSKNIIYKRWQIADFNNDHQPDLLFVGRYQDNFFGAKVAMICFSKGKDSFIVKDLVRPMEEPALNPLIRVMQQQQKKYLAVYLFIESSNFEWDSIIQKKHHQYPEKVKWVDTLIYKNGSIVNYNQFPSKIIFDSIHYTKTGGMAGAEFRIRMYKDGTAVLSDPIAKNNNGDKTIAVGKTSLTEINELIYNMDVNTVRMKYRLYATDLSAADLIVFSKGNTYHFHDYGMQSSFTLIRLYELFSGIVQPYNE